MSKTVSQYIVDYLIRSGVEYIAGIPGHGCLAFFDAVRERAEKGDIKYIQVKQEMSAVHLADGYYRATGKPLVVFTSIGPGSLNTLIGLGTCYTDSTPVLAIVGDAHTHMRGVGLLQEIEHKHDSDVLSCFRPITKRAWRMESASQAPKIIKRAFKLMNEGRKGPVAITMPMDIQAKELDIPEEAVPALLPAGAPVADEDQIREAVAVMREAKRPVIVAGGGALYANATDLLVELAELWGAAVVTTMAGKSVFPEEHELYGWHGGSKGTDVGNYLCRTADVVLALGCRFADETTSSYRKGVTYNFPETKLIHVDIDEAELGKNYPCTVGIRADLCAAARQLIDGLKQSGRAADYRGGEYYADIQRAKTEWFARLDGIRAAAGDRLTISGFLQKLRAAYPREGILVTSSGNTQAQVLQEYCFAVPKTHITTGGFSTMGFSVPAAMGVKLAKPDVPVMALVGDGDFMMTMQEMATAKQYGIGIVMVVANNCGWMAIRDLQLDVYGEPHDFGNNFTTTDGKPYSPDFCKTAEAFGIEAIKVTQTAQVEDAIRKAVSDSKEGPVLVEVMVTDDYPYSGGTATGWWDVPVPGYITDREKAYSEGVSQEYIR